MGKSLLIASSNIRRSKGLTVILALMSMLASAMLIIALTLSFSYSGFYDSKAERLNAEDLFVILRTQDAAAVEDFTTAMTDTGLLGGAEAHSCYLGSVTAKMSTDDEMTQQAVILPKSTRHEIGRSAFGQCGPTDNGIYLPYSLKTSYPLGSTFSFKLDGKAAAYEVCGYFENAITSGSSWGFFALYLSDPLYEAARFNSGTYFALTVKEGEDALNAVMPLTRSIMSSPYYAAQMELFSYTYAEVKTARCMGVTMTSLMLTLLSLLLVAVMLIVMGFRIKDSITEHIKDIGVLKALGYTSRQIVAIHALQFLTVACAGILAGIAMGYAALPAITGLFALQLGLIWPLPFSLPALLLTIAAVAGLTAAVSALASLSVRKLPPITALREGITTHSFKKNPLPLETCKVPLVPALGIKSLLANLRKNVGVFIIVLVMSVFAVFGGSMYYNMSVDTSAMLFMMSGESFDIALEFSPQSGVTSSDVASLPDVKLVYGLNGGNGFDVKGYNVLAQIYESFDVLCSDGNVYEGRFPKHDNEIMIGASLAAETEIKKGDTVAVKCGAYEFDYLVVGLVQSGNNVGRVIQLTEEAAKRIMPDFVSVTFACNVTAGKDINEVITAIKSAFGEKLISARNYREEAAGSIGMFKGMSTALALVVLILVLAGTALIMTLLISTLLLHQRKNFGLQKALGFTSGQLIAQLTLTFAPVLAAGSIAGSLIGMALVNPLATLIFRSSGIMKAGLIVHPAVALVCIAVISAAGTAICALASLGVRKVSPHALMTSE